MIGGRSLDRRLGVVALIATALAAAPGDSVGRADDNENEGDSSVVVSARAEGGETVFYAKLAN